MSETPGPGPGPAASQDEGPPSLIAISEEEDEEEIQQQQRLLHLLQEQLQEGRLHLEIVRLLRSRTPNTLHIRQRHAAAIHPRRQGSDIWVRYCETRVLVEAVVWELGVVGEVVSAPALMGRAGAGEAGEMGGRSIRSCVARKRWLARVEKRVEEGGRYCSRRKGESDGLDSIDGVVSVPKRMTGRQEPYRERMAKGAGEEAAEYAAVVGERLLHPGVLVPSRGRLSGVSASYLQQSRAVARKEETVRDVKSRNDSAVGAEQPMVSTATIEPDSVFRSIRDMVSGNAYFRRVMALRKGRQVDPVEQNRKGKGKGKERCTSAGAARRWSSNESVKSRASTTSGLPSEVTAGLFGVGNPSRNKDRGREREKKTWWPSLRASSEAALVPRVAGWGVGPANRKSQGAGSEKRHVHVGCAPGPSTRKAPLDDVRWPEKSFCGSCEPIRQKAQVRTHASQRASLEGQRRKIPTEAAPRAGTHEAKMTSLPGKSNSYPPRRNPYSRSCLPQTPEYGAIQPLAPQLESLLPKTTSSETTALPLNNDNENGTFSRLKIDNFHIDERAIWMKCSKRLDHVSDTAATEAWATICRERKREDEKRKASSRLETTAVEEGRQRTEAEGTPLSLRSVPSVRVFATDTAERVSMKVIKVVDVDCRSVAGRREVPVPKQSKADASSSSRGWSMQRDLRKKQTTGPMRATRWGHKRAVKTPGMTSLRSIGTPKASKSKPTTQSLDPVVNPANRPLNTPWEAAWHANALPTQLQLQLRRTQTPSSHTDSAASVPYSLSAAVAEREELEEQLQGPSRVRYQEVRGPRYGTVVEVGEGERRRSLEAVRIGGKGRVDSKLEVNGDGEDGDQESGGG